MSLGQLLKGLFILPCLFLSILQCIGQDTYEDKHIEVSLRMIGHQILLNAGDSTSRVLPIVKEDDRYRIEFETDFEFVPDEMVATIERIMKKTEIAKGYILEVEECETGKIVYSYEVVQFVEKDIIPCQARLQPECCYRLVLNLRRPSLLDAAISKEEGSDEAALHSATIIPITGKKSEDDSPNYLLFALLLIGAGGLSFFLWKRRQDEPTDPNIIPIGKYQFDKRNTELRIEDRKIELTTKEAELLLFLYNTVNTTVEREVILNMVWGDEGDYVGRTLDVFISKLRKKLDADSSVKIINIRGVGYKLIADV